MKPFGNEVLPIILLGGYGQLGTALSRVLGERAVPLTRQEADLLNAHQLFATLDELSPGTVINCAAYNFVDRAEEEPEAAYALNADAPGRLAEWCNRRGVPLVHISSDYVFGGDASKTTPFTEDDEPAPLSQYGRSKLQGEQNVQSACRRHFVLRTCGLYGPRRSPGKGNFVETMLRLGETRKELSVVDDQVCTPTYALDLAEAIATLIDTSKYGLYHATNSGETSWCRFAAEIFRQSGRDITVTPITSEEYQAAAARPSYSVLSCGKLESVTGRQFRDWESALSDYLNSRSGTILGENR